MLHEVNLRGVQQGHARGHAFKKKLCTYLTVTTGSSSDLVLDPQRGRMLMECGKVGRVTKLSHPIELLAMIHLF